jgi:hypothetical protein
MSSSPAAFQDIAAAQDDEDDEIELLSLEPLLDPYSIRPHSTPKTH